MVIRFEFLQKVQFSNGKSISIAIRHEIFQIVTLRMRIAVYGAVGFSRKGLLLQSIRYTRSVLKTLISIKNLQVLTQHFRMNVESCDIIFIKRFVVNWM